MGEPHPLKASSSWCWGPGQRARAVVAGMLLGIFQNLAVAYLPTALTGPIIYSVAVRRAVVKFESGLFGSEGVQAGVARR